MNRILLALLAMLTGLTIQAGPAHARMCGVSETEVNAAECARSAARSTATQAADSTAAKGDRRDRESPRPKPVLRPRVYIPTVQFGADRAYE